MGWGNDSMTRGRCIRFLAGGGLVLSLLGYTDLALAQSLPVISGVTGTAQQGSQITISGLGFGTKGVAAPLRWDNFESGTAGDIIGNDALGNAWDVDCAGGTGNCQPDYSNSVRRTNSNMSARARFLPGSWESSFYVSGVNLNKVYMDAWYYYAPGPIASPNHKIFRIHANTYTPNLYFNIYCINAGTHLSQDGSGEVGTWHYWPSIAGGAGYFLNKWVHLQGYFEMSSSMANDGTALLWVDNFQWVNERKTWNTTPNSTSYWSSFYFGNFMEHDPGASSCGPVDTGYTFWDNAYLDTTQAHVELGNMPTYAACTLREVQVPTSWSPTAVTVKLNQGAFTNLSNTYVYVTNRDGLVNAVGVSPCTTCPPPVLDLTAPTAALDLRARPGP